MHVLKQSSENDCFYYHSPVPLMEFLRHRSTAILSTAIPHLNGYNLFIRLQNSKVDDFIEAFFFCKT